MHALTCEKIMQCCNKCVNVSSHIRLICFGTSGYQSAAHIVHEPDRYQMGALIPTMFFFKRSYPRHIDPVTVNTEKHTIESIRQRT